MIFPTRMARPQCIFRCRELVTVDEVCMPTYDYRCHQCGHTFETMQSIAADPLTQCPQTNCDGTVERFFSAGSGFLLKGSGFYATDYRSSSYSKGAAADSAN